VKMVELDNGWRNYVNYWTW